MENSKRSRYWAIVLFEDNIQNYPLWKSYLINTHIRFCISPYHDQDIWTESDILEHPEREEYIKEHIGEKKKPHYHIMFHCDDNTTFKTIKEIVEPLSCAVPNPVVAPDGMYSYFSHEHNPEKHKYDVNDIKHFNGSDPSEYIFNMSIAKTSAMLDELTEIFVALKVTKYYEMVQVAAKMKDPRYKHLVQSHIYYFKQILVDIINIVKKEEDLEIRKLPKGRKYNG